MQVIILNKKKKRIHVKINSNDKIVDLKQKLTVKRKCLIKKSRICVDSIILKNKDDILENDKLLSDYNIKEGDTISIFLNVQWRDGNSSDIHSSVFEYDDCVSGLAKHCCQELRVSDIVLTSKSKKCNDHDYLRKYLRKENAVFTVVERLHHSLEKGRKLDKKESIDRTDGRNKEMELKLENDNGGMVRGNEGGQPDPGLISLIVVNKTKETSVETRVSVSPNFTVDKIRCIIAGEMSLVSSDIDICCQDGTMMYGAMDKYNLKNNDVIVLQTRKNPRHFGEQFVIAVKNVKDNKEQKCLIDDFETVAALKQTLREQYNVKLDHIRLWSDEKEWENEDVIREMDIANGTVVMLEIMEENEEHGGEIRVKVVYNIVGGEKKTYEVAVCEEESVETLRQRVDDVCDDTLATRQCVLSYKGEIMKNENKVGTYNIRDGDQVHVSNSLLVRYFVAGDNFGAKVNRYPFMAHDNVAELKKRITKKLNIEARFINLILDGNVLEDNMVLEEIGVENDSYLMMISTLAGG